MDGWRRKIHFVFVVVFFVAVYVSNGRARWMLVKVDAELRYVDVITLVFVFVVVVLGVR